MKTLFHLFFDATAKSHESSFCVLQKSLAGAFSTVTSAGNDFKLPTKSFLQSIKKSFISTFGSRVFFCSVAVLLLGTGCATGKEAQTADSKAAEKQEKPESAPITDPKAAAFQHVAGMEKAIRTRDVAPLLAGVPEESRTKIRPQQFKRLLSSLDLAGVFQGVNYLGILDNMPVQNYLWKFTFEKKEKDGKVQRVELLYLVKMYQDKNGFHFAGCGFKKI